MAQIPDSYPNPRAKLVAAFLPLPSKELIGNALIVSERVFMQGVFTSALIKKFRVEARKIKSCPEVITRDITNVSEDCLANLDERGIIKVGSKIKKNDLLVGKVTPRGYDMSSEERLLWTILGEKPKVRNDSFEMPYEDEGVVIDTKYVSRKKGGNLPSGINEIAEVYVSIKRELKIGDILRDKKGNGGTVIKISPLPFYKTDKMIDIVADPSSDIISCLEDCKTKSAWRFEGSPLLHLYREGIKSTKQIADIKKKEGLKSGHIKKREFESMIDEEVKKYKYLGKAKIGYLTLEKLTVPSEKKISARSIGAYSIVSHQPLANSHSYPKFARISEKELSALKAYPTLIKEAVTLRSDAVKKRTKVYGALLKNERF